MVTQRTVYAGTCFRDNKLVCGVVEPQDYCDEGSWVPPHVVADMGHPNRICAYYPDTMVIGRCGAGGPCSNLAERCEDPDSFLPRDPDCRITRDYGTSEQPTTYGRCGESRCVWSREDCNEGEDYTVNDPACTANRVKLGACLDGFGYCTVSPSTCTNADGTVEPYYTHEAFLEKFGTNCYLADLPRTPSPVAPTVAPVVLPTVPPEPSVVPLQQQQQQATGSLSQNALLGVVIGTTLPVGMAIGFILARKNSARQGVVATKGYPQEQAVQADPPPQTIDLGNREVAVDAAEDLSLA
mmetsp:Transcript_19828/g.41020  ORF Transcript_19828/g.41020 Transcript_19828/m.41020 type:complete len:297 (+) Transcript_19828:324-1214(+)